MSTETEQVQQQGGPSPDEVWGALSPAAQARTSWENVADTLAALAARPARRPPRTATCADC